MIHEFKQPISIITPDGPAWAIYATKDAAGKLVWGVVVQVTAALGCIKHVDPHELDIVIEDFVERIKRVPNERDLGVVGDIITRLENTGGKYDLATDNIALRIQLDAVQSTLDDYENAAKGAMDERCDAVEKHCSCVPVLRGEVASLRKRFNTLLNS